MTTGVERPAEPGLGIAGGLHRVVEGISLGDSIRGAVGLRTTAKRVVEQSLSMIAGARGVAVEILVDGHLQPVFTSGDLNASRPWSASRTGLADAAITSGLTQRCDDTELDPRVDRLQCERLGIRSLLCVPLLDDANHPIGVVKVGAPEPHAFVDEDVSVLDQLAQFIASAIQCATRMQAATTRLLSGLGQPGTTTRPTIEFAANVISPRLASAHATRERIARIIVEGDFEIWLQPIVDLGTCEAVGYEALARLGPQHGTIETVLADAYEVGLGVELDLVLCRAALELQPLLPTGVYLAVNVGPLLFADPRFTELVAQACGIVFEITEQHPITDHPMTASIIGRLRSRGNRLAIDDTGAGFASLSHLLQLQPDIVKLDRALTIGIDSDPIRQALSAALVSFADATGAIIVAEGIENDDQLETIRRLGVRYGQGFYIGRPAPSSTHFTSAGSDVDARGASDSSLRQSPTSAPV
jgi:EAL domain-containing protein (putative c-di-GMP-specific phosphodiesterase class I)